VINKYKLMRRKPNWLKDNLMRHTISISALLAAIWIANSGHYTGLMLSFGVLSVALVVWICHRMDVVDHESQPLHLTFSLPGYYFWLAGKILLSNLDVVKRVWLGSSAIAPVIKTLSLPQTTDLGRVIYANSINLTPGTVSLEVNESTIVVHALVLGNIAALEEGEMSDRISRLEK
jgi:multicomponent Na+:H+ antiporter subunit E